MSTNDFNPATLNQLLTQRASQVLAEHLPELSGLVSVTGRLSDPGQPRGQWHYGVRISDDGGRMVVDIPLAIVAGRQLRAGQTVTVTGVLKVRPGQPGTIELKIEASDVRVLDQQEPARCKAATENEAAHEPPAAAEKHPFPVRQRGPLLITMIQSSSRAQVAEDCMSELQKLGSQVRVQRLTASMLEPAAIANAIERAKGDVVMLIRGGGDEEDFEVFADPRVVKAMRENGAYRVIGLGHSGNATGLDGVVEHVARTPGQAGMHVREMVQNMPARQVVSPPRTWHVRPEPYNWKQRAFQAAVAVAGVLTAVIVLAV